jgi:hypothetical protein
MNGQQIGIMATHSMFRMREGKIETAVSVRQLTFAHAQH